MANEQKPTTHNAPASGEQVSFGETMMAQRGITVEHQAKPPGTPTKPPAPTPGPPANPTSPGKRSGTPMPPRTPPPPPKKE